jgi:hypothetical protein
MERKLKLDKDGERCLINDPFKILRIIAGAIIIVKKKHKLQGALLWEGTIYGAGTNPLKKLRGGYSHISVQDAT